LQRREQYAATLGEGAAVSRRHFMLFARPNGLSQARIGIIASRKVAPRAVDRNRAKRLVRETFRVIRQRLAGMDIVVRLRRCPPPCAAAAARAELTRLLAELSVRSVAHGEKAGN
jgi:ribonuclease P protein component